MIEHASPAPAPEAEPSFYAASERNKAAILQVLAPRWRAAARVSDGAARTHVLEIGSGGAQHAAYFAANLSGSVWQCSEHPATFPGLLTACQRWQAPELSSEYPDPSRLAPPIELDVAADWPERLSDPQFDAAYGANILHIMPWTAVVSLFQQLPKALRAGAEWIVYGPFKFAGRCTTESNAAFDAQLRAENPAQGLRDFEALDELARGAGWQFVEKLDMPANNHCLVWRKASTAG